jgi:hypothetical protein
VGNRRNLERILSIPADFIYDTARLYITDIHGKKLVSHGIKIRSVLHTYWLKTSYLALHIKIVGSGLVSNMYDAYHRIFT